MSELTRPDNPPVVGVKAVVQVDVAAYPVDPMALRPWAGVYYVTSLLRSDGSYTDIVDHGDDYQAALARATRLAYQHEVEAFGPDGEVIVSP